MSESSESKSSQEEKQMPQGKRTGKNLIDILKTGNKKICRNDLLNLPSSEDENMVVGISALFLLEINYQIYTKKAHLREEGHLAMKVMT